VAAAALYETLFTRRAIEKPENTILIDIMAEDWGHLKGEEMKVRSRKDNIVCAFDVIFVIGWRRHESQQKPKERGSATFSLKDVLNQIKDEEGEEAEVKYGVLVEEGDEVIEK